MLGALIWTLSYARMQEVDRLELESRWTLGNVGTYTLTDIPTVLARQKARMLPALIVLISGLINLVYGLLPRTGRVQSLDRSGLLTPLLASRLLAVMVGIGFLFVARMLWRGSRLAWTAGLVAASVDLLIAVFSPRVTWSAGFTLLALIALILTRKAFRLEIPIRPRKRLLIPLSLFGALVLFALVSYRELGAVAQDTVQERLMEIMRVMTFGHPLRGRRAVFSYTVVVQFGFVLVLLAAAWALFTSRHNSNRRPGTMSNREVQLFVERYGRSSAAPLLMLEDNSLLTVCGGDALVGLGVSNNVAVSLGAPVAPPDLEEAALREFVDHCERVGWTPALIATDLRQRDLAAKVGFRSLRIGVEAFLDVPSFSQRGSRRANVRHTVTRARKEGLVVRRWSPEIRTDQRVRQLRAISNAWLQTKGGPELGFTLGRFDPEIMNVTEAYIAIVGEGTEDERVVGFVTWLPYDGGRSAVLDLMRRAEPCPPGTIETLLVDSIEDFKSMDRPRCSLGGVPLASVESREGRVQELLGWVYENGGSVYEARGLFRYKDKFDPQWEPMYLCYPERSDLPSVAVAVLRSYLPRGAVSEAIKAFNEHRRRDAERRKTNKAQPVTSPAPADKPDTAVPHIEPTQTNPATATAPVPKAPAPKAPVPTAPASQDPVPKATASQPQTAEPKAAASKAAVPNSGAAAQSVPNPHRGGPKPDEELTPKQLKRRKKRAEKKELGKEKRL